MTVRVTNAQGGGGSAIDPVDLGNLGAAANLALSASTDKWRAGVLTQNLTFTVTNYVPAARAVLEFKQDGPGGHSFTLSDGAGNNVVLPIPAGGNAPFKIVLDCVVAGVLRWSLSATIAAAGVPYTPTAPLVSINVQDAIDELLVLASRPATATVLGTVKITGTPTDAANPVVRVRESSDASYAQAQPHLVLPPATSILQINGTSTMTALTPRGIRVAVPENGALRDFAIYVGVQNGNISGAIYDCGDVTANVYTKLWDSGSVACPAVGWQILGDPNLTGLLAGKRLIFFINADGVTASIGKLTSNSAATQSVLPAGFLPVPGGVSPKTVVSLAALGTVAAWPATVSEANMLTGANPQCPIARMA